jgi:hypothetical protein
MGATVRCPLAETEQHIQYEKPDQHGYPSRQPITMLPLLRFLGTMANRQFREWDAEMMEAAAQYVAAGNPNMEPEYPEAWLPPATATGRSPHRASRECEASRKLQRTGNPFTMVRSCCVSSPRDTEFVCSDCGSVSQGRQRLTAPTNRCTVCVDDRCRLRLPGYGRLIHSTWCVLCNLCLT